MSDIATMVADNLDIWTGAIERKSGAGRGGGKRISLYGIGRLRALILDLAVRGKLVPQDAGDEPASELLKSIKSKKPGYLSTQGLPKQRAIAEPLKHLPFELPASWAWTRLGEIAAYIQRGKSPKYSEGSGVFVVSQRCVQWAGLDLSVAKEISRSSFDNYEPCRLLRPNDLLWNSTGTGTIGRVIALKHVPDGLVCDSHVTVVRCPWMNARYLQFWLASNDVYGQIEVLAAGSTNQIEWTAQLAAAQVVPVPPLAEQQRIVAKVDELMALCDAFERESAGAMAAHQALVEILLATLVNSADATDLARDWARLERHFDTLFTTDACIEALKQTILHLAVRGKLVEQQAGDDEASNVVANARQLMRSKGLADRKPVQKIDKNEIPFLVPKAWEWVRLGVYAKLWNGYAFKSADFGNEGVPVIRIGDLQNGEIDISNAMRVSELVANRTGLHFRIPKGALLIAMSGATTGKTAVNNNSQMLMLNQRVGMFELFAGEQKYMQFFLMTTMAHNLSIAAGSAIPNLSAEQINSTCFPVPPLAEQRRIVAKVDALMALCDALKARLADAAQTQRHLADAITQRAAA